MVLDLIHDTQFVFRQILDAMSRPGKTVSLEKLNDKNDIDLPIFDATMLAILTLLDAEVTFHVLPTNEKQAINKIVGHTLAKHTALEEADFIIALQHATEAEITEAITKSKKGTLLDPNESATWIIETSNAKENSLVELTGPGIKTSAALQALPSAIWETRNKANIEFPLGIDFILTTDKLQITCVPRTTRAEVQEVQ